MTREEILGVIKSNMEQVIEGARGQSIAESQSMHDFAADSLEIVEVVSRSMKQLKIKIPRTVLGQANNLKDLVDLFEQAGSSAAGSAQG